MYLQSLVQGFERLYGTHFAWRSADLKGAIGALASWGKSIREQSRMAAADHLRRLITMQRAPSISSTGALENVSLDRSAREILVPAAIQVSSWNMQRGSWPTDRFG